MTLQLRPTFSESWYRVAPLRAKLRSSAQISRQYYRGERWYVVRDPAGVRAKVLEVYRARVAQLRVS